MQSAESRLQLYGQADHVRLFGADVLAQIAGDALVPEFLVHGDVMPDVDADAAGINADEGLMLFRPALSERR